MWLESDCNLPSGEPLVRQIIKGEQFFREEFGISSRCLWLPDVFGYSAAIPQILKKCGISYFLTTKIAWNQFNQLPNDTFMWKGIDGSRVFVFMPTACDFDKTLGLNVSFTDTRNTTTYTGIVNPNMTLGTFKRFQNRGRHSEVAGDVVLGILALLLSDNRYGHAVEHGNAAHNGSVILKIPVPVEFNEFIKQSVDIIRGNGAVRFSGKKNRIPGSFSTILL